MEPLEFWEDLARHHHSSSLWISSTAADAESAADSLDFEEDAALGHEALALLWESLFSSPLLFPPLLDSQNSSSPSDPPHEQKASFPSVHPELPRLIAATRKHRLEIFAWTAIAARHLGLITSGQRRAIVELQQTHTRTMDALLRQQVALASSIQTQEQPEDGRHSAAALQERINKLVRNHVSDLERVAGNWQTKIDHIRLQQTLQFRTFLLQLLQDQFLPSTPGLLTTSQTLGILGQNLARLTSRLEKLRSEMISGHDHILGSVLGQGSQGLWWSHQRVLLGYPRRSRFRIQLRNWSLGAAVQPVLDFLTPAKHTASVQDLERKADEILAFYAASSSSSASSRGDRSKEKSEAPALSTVQVPDTWLSRLELTLWTALTPSELTHLRLQLGNIPQKPVTADPGKQRMTFERLSLLLSAAVLSAHRSALVQWTTRRTLQTHIPLADAQLDRIADSIGRRPENQNNFDQFATAAVSRTELVHPEMPEQVSSFLRPSGDPAADGTSAKGQGPERPQGQHDDFVMVPTAHSNLQWISTSFTAVGAADARGEELAAAVGSGLWIAERAGFGVVYLPLLLHPSDVLELEQRLRSVCRQVALQEQRPREAPDSEQDGRGGVQGPLLSEKLESRIRALLVTVRSTLAEIASSRARSRALGSSFHAADQGLDTVVFLADFLDTERRRPFSATPAALETCLELFRDDVERLFSQVFGDGDSIPA